MIIKEEAEKLLLKYADDIFFSKFKEHILTLEDIVDNLVEFEKNEKEEMLEYLTPIEEEFKKGGRWSNYKIKIYQLGSKYIRVTKEVPATEIQEGMDYLEYSWEEVFPKEITIVKYVSKY